MKTADEVSWCLMAQRGIFLIIVEPVAPEKRGVCNIIPSFLALLHFACTVICCCWSHSRFNFQEGQRLMLMHLWRDSCPQHLAQRLTHGTGWSQITEIQNLHEVLSARQATPHKHLAVSFRVPSSPCGCFLKPREHWSQRAVVLCCVSRGDCELNQGETKTYSAQWNQDQ